MLWWGWLAFNSGSTYGVSGFKWQYAARAAVMTMMSSFGGGCFAIFYSMYQTNGNLDIVHLINGILGSLVAVTAGCYLYHAWEAILIGIIGSFLTCVAMPVIDHWGIDDPVGASAVHGVSGIWGVIAVGLFADNPIPLATTNGRTGLFKGGGWYLLGIQCLSALCLTVWGLGSTFLLLWMIDKFVPIRMEASEELLGADLMEHHIKHGQIGISRALSALAPLHVNLNSVRDVPQVGVNPGHESYINEVAEAAKKLEQWRKFEERVTDSAKYRKRTSLMKRIFHPRQSHRLDITAADAISNGRFKATHVEEADAERQQYSAEAGHTNFAWVE